MIAFRTPFYFSVMLGGALFAGSGCSSRIDSTFRSDSKITSAVLSLTGHDFGTLTLGSAGSVILTLANNGSFQATAITPILTAPFAFFRTGYPGVNGTCTTALAAGQQCVVEISFSPAAIGAVTGSLTVNYFDGATSRTLSVTLSGSGIGASGALDPTFGNYGRTITPFF